MSCLARPCDIIPASSSGMLRVAEKCLRDFRIDTYFELNYVYGLYICLFSQIVNTDVALAVISKGAQQLVSANITFLR